MPYRLRASLSDVLRGARKATALRVYIVRPHRKIGRGLDVWPVAMRIAGTRNEVRVRVGRSRDAFWLCLLKGGNPEPSLFTLHSACSLLPAPRYRLFAASRCRFSLPFLLPLLVAASGCRLAKHILSMVYSPKIEGLRVEGFRD